MTEDDINAYLQLPLKDAVILDVGAYNGDSAMLFLHNGAKRVIAIEPYYHHDIPKDPRITVVPELFRLSHLEEFEYDCMKMDIEGWEELLLDYKKPLKPSVVEVHGQQLWEKFLAKGWCFVSKSNAANCVALMKNF